MPPSCIIQQVWVASRSVGHADKRFPQNLMTTLCATITALADPDTVMVEGEHAREMRALGVERGRDVLALAKRVKEMNLELEEMRIRERALAPLLKALGGAQAVPSLAGQQEPSATVDGHRNPDLPAPAAMEELVEDPESGLLVPAGEFAGQPAQARQLPTQPPLVGSVSEPRPPFVRRMA